MCVCVCLCVCVRARACVRACVLYAVNLKNNDIQRICKRLGPVQVRRSKYPLSPLLTQIYLAKLTDHLDPSFHSRRPLRIPVPDGRRGGPGVHSETPLTPHPAAQKPPASGLLLAGAQRATRLPGLPGPPLPPPPHSRLGCRPCFRLVYRACQRRRQQLRWWWWWWWQASWKRPQGVSGTPPERPGPRLRPCGLAVPHCGVPLLQLRTP